VELVEVPPPPQQPALLATALAPIGSGADVMDSDDDDDPHWGPRPVPCSSSPSPWPAAACPDPWAAA
jgi:hypothetical protein